MRRVVATVFLSALIFSGTSFAKTLYSHIDLVNIKADKASETHGDEIYFAVAAYPSQGRGQYYQVPKHPLSWPSKALSQIENVKLWKDEISEGQSVTVVLALVEQDAPPFNPDDLLGEVEVKLTNVKGQLKQEWNIPHRSNQFGHAITASQAKGQVYEFNGESSKYRLALSASASATPPSDKS